MKMLENELTDSVKELKTAPVKIIIAGLIVIVGALAGVIIYLNASNNDVKKEKYDAVVAEKNAAIAENKQKDSTIAALNQAQYQFVLKQLEFEQQQKVVKVFIDSMTHEVNKINRTLK